MSLGGPVSAASQRLWNCECCGLVSEIVKAAVSERCPRCGFALHARKPQSLQRTTAYLLAAVVYFVICFSVSRIVKRLQARFNQ